VVVALLWPTSWAMDPALLLQLTQDPVAPYEMPLSYGDGRSTVPINCRLTR